MLNIWARRLYKDFNSPDDTGAWGSLMQRSDGRLHVGFPLWSRLRKFLITTTTTTTTGNSLAGGTKLRAFDFGFIDCSLEAKCKQRALQLLTAFSNTMSRTNTSATGMISNFSSALSSPTGLTSPSISRPSFPLFGTREVHDSRYVPAKGHPLVREAIPIHMMTR